MDNVRKLKLRSIIFYALILLLLGGFHTAIQSYNVSIALIEQSSEQLSKISAEYYTFSLAGLSMIRQLSPHLTALEVAFLSPILIMFTYFFVVKKTEIDIKIKIKAFGCSVFVSALVVTPLLVALSVFLGWYAASQKTGMPLQRMNEFLKVIDYIACLVKSLAFGGLIGGIGILQIRQIPKKPVVVIVSVILAIAVGMIGVTILDIGLTSLFYFMR